MVLLEIVAGIESVSCLTCPNEQYYLISTGILIATEHWIKLIHISGSASKEEINTFYHLSN